MADRLSSVAGSRTAPSPRATYRLQLNKDFGFDAARRIVPYLAGLGVSHVYASPVLMARPGSMHGYDIVDHNRLNPEIGDERAFETFIDALRTHGLELVLDFVPNHMGIGQDNPWWCDVLEWGRASPFAGFFDIDWEPLEPSLAGKVLLPVLGDHYGAVLERGELSLKFDANAGTFHVAYYDKTFPVSPREYAGLLERAAARNPSAEATLRPLATALRTATRRVRGTHATDAQRAQVAALKAQIAAAAQAAEIRDAIVNALDAKGHDDAYGALHRLLDRQSYRLAYHQLAAHEINYRRFFDINDLAGLRMEEPALFEASHRLLRGMIATGQVQGVRLDHVDGLADPAAYLARLQRLAARASASASAAAPAPRARRRGRSAFYIIVEKILAAHERLRSDWAVSGTTGYEFMAAVNGLFVDSASEPAFTRLHAEFVGDTTPYARVERDAKRQVVRESFAAQLNVIANAVHRVAKRHRDTRDFSLIAIRDALVDVVAHFPVYRTYVDAGGASPLDVSVIASAVDGARRLAHAPDTSVYDFVRRVLTLEAWPGGAAYRRRVLGAARRFQQLTGPVMAKSVEDTAFYRYVRLVSLNEVGGDPGQFGTSVTQFHAANAERAQTHPRSMVTTSTHDHKRGEDVRARINVLTEMPREWARRVTHWHRLTADLRRREQGDVMPSARDEYLFYQTVVGALPLDASASGASGASSASSASSVSSEREGQGAEFRERVVAYARKAAREAGISTSWLAVNEAYEQALADFVTRALDRATCAAFVDDLRDFVHSIAAAGAVNGLAQLVLKLTSPGVADIYQGTEFWDLSLVDPDNRRPVDYDTRARGLAESPTPDWDALMSAWRDGRVKQRVMERVLAFRRARPRVFAEGTYTPLRSAGTSARRVVAFARTMAAHDESGRTLVVSIVPRLAWALVRERATPLPSGWADTRVAVPAGRTSNTVFRDAITGAGVQASRGWIAVEEVLSTLPVALLVADG